MNKKLLKSLCLLMAVSFSLLPLAGCGGVPAMATATPAASATPDPTPAQTPTPSPTATPSPTPTPTLAPTPSPTPTPPGDRPDVTVVQYYGKNSDNALPPGLGISLKYKSYWDNNSIAKNFIDYVVAYPRAATIRELPDAGAKALQTVKLIGRMPLLAEVLGTDGKSKWYRVRLTDTDGIGYVAASQVVVRTFQLDQAFSRVEALKKIADMDNTSRVANYNNAAGLPPKQPGGKTVDSKGNSRDQAAPAYLAPDATSAFDYAPDGTLCEVLSTVGDFIQVYFPGWGEMRYVPAKSPRGRSYLTSGDPIKSLTQAIVVDRTNQNVMVFEYIDGQWNIVSMSVVSSGASHGAHRPTPLGDFFTERHIGKRLGIGEFFFFPDGTPETDAEGHAKFEGYAPYAIRFTGGAYLHGMPIGARYDAEDKLVTSRRTSEVYGNFLGVYPASHECVRNYTSHAKFMYNWVDDGQASVIVMQ